MSRCRTRAGSARTRAARRCRTRVRPRRRDPRSRRVRRRPPHPGRPLPRDGRVARARAAPEVESATRRRGSAPCRCRGRCAARCRGGAPVGLPSATIVGAVHDHAVHADRVGEEPRRCRRADRRRSFTSPVATVSGSKQHEVGVEALAQLAAVAQAEQLRGRLRHQLHAPFERDELAARGACRRGTTSCTARRTCGRGARRRRSRRSSRAGGPTPRRASATTSGRCRRAAATGSSAGRR